MALTVADWPLANRDVWTWFPPWDWGAGQRACGLNAMSRSADAGLFDLGVDMIEDNRRGFSLQREIFSLVWANESVVERTRDFISTAICNRSAGDGEPTVMFWIEAPPGL